MADFIDDKNRLWKEDFIMDGNYSSFNPITIGYIRSSRGSWLACEEAGTFNIFSA
jgi:hypothetical protein